MRKGDREWCDDLLLVVTVETCVLEGLESDTGDEALAVMVHWVLALGLGVEFGRVVLGKEGLPEGPVAANDERQGRGLVEGVHGICLTEDSGIEANNNDCEGPIGYFTWIVNKSKLIFKVQNGGRSIVSPLSC